jgi:hypothetical protein
MLLIDLLNLKSTALGLRARPVIKFLIFSMGLRAHPAYYTDFIFSKKYEAGALECLNVDGNRQ